MTASDVDINDIAHGLSMQCRFGGHCREFYSVAEHSVHVAGLVKLFASSTVEVLSALLHDAAEAYIVDIPRPLKMQPEFDGYHRVEARIHAVICERFGLPPIISHATKVADEVALESEARLLMQPDLIGWRVPREPAIELQLLGPREARAAFLAAFEEYGGKS